MTSTLLVSPTWWGRGSLVLELSMPGADSRQWLLGGFSPRQELVGS